MKMDEIINALQAGEIVSNPVEWKNAQKMTSNIVVLLAGILAVLKLFGVDLHVSDEALVGVATIIAALLGAANSIITVITSRKVGFK
jgi:hypothetical protein